MLAYLKRLALRPGLPERGCSLPERGHSLERLEITEDVRRRLVSEASREPAPLTFREKEPLGGPRLNEPGVDCICGERRPLCRSSY